MSSSLATCNINARNPSRAKVNDAATTFLKEATSSAVIVITNRHIPQFEQRELGHEPEATLGRPLRQGIDKHTSTHADELDSTT